MAFSSVTGPPKGCKFFQTEHPFSFCRDGASLPTLTVAYETWGCLNAEKSNAIVIASPFSGSSHAASSETNRSPGWWEKFVGPCLSVDTNKFFLICANNLGSCYGTSGPSSVNKETGKPYGTTFPLIEVQDMTNALLLLLDHLGIDKVHAVIGGSLGGMLALQFAITCPERLSRVISVSACVQTNPFFIGLSYLQRKSIMSDPHWNMGHYYDGEYPIKGLMLSREIAMLTYRSADEWRERFGRGRIPETSDSIQPSYLVESYLEHHGEKFTTAFDPNSVLYLTKAMDNFDAGAGYSSIREALSRVTCEVMIIGTSSDFLIPIQFQQEVANLLRDTGNQHVQLLEFDSFWGHDSFLLDVKNMGTAFKDFLE